MAAAVNESVTKVRLIKCRKINVDNFCVVSGIFVDRVWHHVSINVVDKIATHLVLVSVKCGHVTEW